MPFNLGDVWKSLDESGKLHRAIVAAVKDGGREGTLFYDTGDELSFLWADFSNKREWLVDTSPKPTLTADRLREMTLQIIQRHPVCPAGMSVEIRGTSGSDWEALAVPPSDQHIAYTDCADYISEVTSKLRLLYGIRDVHTAISGAASKASAGAFTPEVAVGLTGAGSNASAGAFLLRRQPRSG